MAQTVGFAERGYQPHDRKPASRLFGWSIPVVVGAILLKQHQYLIGVVPLAKVTVSPRHAKVAILVIGVAIVILLLLNFIGVCSRGGYRGWSP